MGTLLNSGFLKNALGRCLSDVQDLVLPAKCMQCGRYIDPIQMRDPLESCFCPQCLNSPLPRFSPPYCPSCGHLFPRSDQKSHLCENCLKSPPGITKVRAAFAYEGIIRAAVALLKYQSRIRLAKPFEHHLYESFERHFFKVGIDLILPIPLHPTRAWHRQFNQSVLLVRNFSRLYYARHGKSPSWQVNPELMYRNRATPSQTGLDGKLREKNLKSAFALGVPDTVTDKKILLVDDVYTSGATCRAAADCLFGAGARQVDVLVLARA